MPHLILEYSSNVKEKENFEPLFYQLHQILVNVCSADLDTCQSRAVERTVYYIGNGNTRNAFVHLEVLLKEGRPMRIREQIGRQMLEILNEHFSGSLNELNLQISVESKEFPKNLYFKTPQ